MQVPRTTGLVAAVFSPLDPLGALNLNVVPVYARHLREKGVVGVFVNGSSGEGFSLSTDEREKVAEAWIHAGHEVGLKVIVHCTHLVLEEERRLAAHAQRAGADAIGGMGPLYFKPRTVDKLVDYCARGAAAAPGLPWYYYNIPRMTGFPPFDMVEFMARASAAIPTFAGVKFSDPGDFPGLASCKCFGNGRFDVMHGQDESLLSALALGVASAIGSTYSFAAPVYTRIIDAFARGDMETATRCQFMSVDLVRALVATGEFFPACKEVMRWLGIDLGICRPPHAPVPPEKAAKLRTALEGLDFFTTVA